MKNTRIFVRRTLLALASIVVSVVAVLSLAPQPAHGAVGGGGIVFPLVEKVWVDTDGNKISDEDLQILVEEDLIPNEIQLFFTVSGESVVSGNKLYWHSFRDAQDDNKTKTTDEAMNSEDSILFNFGYLPVDEAFDAANPELHIETLTAANGWKLDYVDGSVCGRAASSFMLWMNPDMSAWFNLEAERIPEGYQVEQVSIEVSDEIVEVPDASGEGFYDGRWITLTNRYTGDLPKRDIQVTKTWDDASDQDGLRPSSVTVKLLADGEDTGLSRVISADTNWTATFEGVDTFKGDGTATKIVYTIEEVAIDGYTCAITGDADDGFTITNTHTPGKTQVSVTKSWDDENDKDGLRPAAVTVTLLADGEDTGETLTLTAEDNWTGSFTDLDLMKDGTEIAYTVEEVAVEGYEASIEGDAEAGYTITNKHTPKPEEPKPEEPKPEEPKPETPKPETPQPAVPKSEIPHTGDDTNPVLPLTLLALAGAGFAGAYRLRKREER